MVTFEQLDRHGQLPCSVSLQKYSKKSGMPLSSESMCFYSHLQPTMEIIILKEGKLNVKLALTNYHLEPGDCVIINPYTLHYGSLPANTPKCSYYCLIFDMSFFAACLPEPEKQLALDIYESKSRFESFLPKNQSMEILRCLEKLYGYFIECNNCRISHTILEILAELFERCYSHNQLNNRKTRAFVKNIYNYVCDNYSSDLTTSTVSAAFHMNENYFCRRFRSCYGISFMTYLNEFRIHKAVEIGSIDIPRTELAAKVGFSDYQSFARAFKKVYHISAGQYFKQ